MNVVIGYAKGKQVLKLQANKTKLSKEGEEDGREEVNNALERWYLEKKRHNNKDHDHRHEQ
jgi:hypothetical protein